MADITLRLIWYRLGETRGKMAEAAGQAWQWYEDFTSDHILDILLFGFIGWAGLCMLVLKAWVLVFGPIQFRQTERSREGGQKTSGHTGEGEGLLWLNSTLNWFYLHYNVFPQFVETWLKSLNDQAQKLGGPVQIKFEEVQSGSLPPKLSDVYSEPGSKDSIIVRSLVDSRDLSFRVFASQQTHESVKLTNLVCVVQKLRGGMKVKLHGSGQDIKAEVSFDGRPDIKLSVKPANPDQDHDDLVDLGVAEEVLRNTICMASTEIAVSHFCSPQIFLAQSLPGQTEPHYKQIQVQDQLSAVKKSELFSAPSKPPRAAGDKSLLVKVIKASGLGGGKDFGTMHPHCYLLVDGPDQQFCTSTAKNTANPFWDEHFLFQVSQLTSGVRFELFDTSDDPENFLGQAVVAIEELRKTPSSRQILPLQMQHEGVDYITGSVTVEFLFMDPMDVDAAQLANQNATKRRVETTLKSTPGTGDTNVSELIMLNDESVAETAIRELLEKSRRPRTPTKTSTLIITSVKRTVENTSTDDSLDITSSLSNASSAEKAQSVGTTPVKEQKKESFGQRILKRFSRKKRARSAERASPHYLAPPDPRYKGSKSTDDIENERLTPPSLKKSRSLGGSLRKLFRRSKRSRSRGGGESSRESSISRSSKRDASQASSRESSLKRQTAQRASVG
ncbi:LOW QUALITY PROTEIN: C2 domain-containing protein 2-like [Liolophura sinensis]|uniref:LOW QUALITY PROTEIN: C2 domain-containing protein 2-like n=1 Tax=Liolophura sinensis TaxID=3198878 RepID=UPI003158AE55